MPSLTEEGLGRLRSLLSTHVEQGKVPGLVAYVGLKGKGRFISLGRTSPGGAETAPDSIFRISSMTKPVTAAATMALVEDGAIQLDDPVDRFIPELAERRVLATPKSPLSDTVPANRKILVRDLLNFTMGFGIFFGDPTDYPILRAMDDLHLGQGPPNYAAVPPFDEWAKRLGSLPLIAQPGDKWMYNTGSDVLAGLVSRASGMRFGDYLHSRLFDPLEMLDTGFSVSPPDQGRFATQYANIPGRNGLSVTDLPRTGQWSFPPAFTSGAGGLVSTAKDYANFAAMLLGQGVFEGRRILSETSVKEMTRGQLTQAQRDASPWVPGYFDAHSWGYGLMVATKDAGQWEPEGSYGWDGGLGTSWRNDPKNGISGVLMTQVMMGSPMPPPVFVDFWEGVYAALAH